MSDWSSDVCSSDLSSQFEGDDIRDELADFVRRIRNEARESIVTEELTRKIAEIIEVFRGGAGVHTI